MTTAIKERRFAPRVRLPPPVNLSGIVAVAGSVGLVLVAMGFALGRSNEHLALGEFLSWVGIAIVVATACASLLREEQPRGERVLIVAVATLLIYAVKVLHDPARFALSDEYVHAANTHFILTRGTLFTPNPLLPVTASYPGLEVVTSAVASVTHFSVFASGLIVIGLARLMLALGLFLVFEALTNSARVAAIAVLLYAGNPNYLYWTAQYSYESLSLPLVVVVLAVLLTADRARPRLRSKWLICALVLAEVIAITHHLSSYLVAALMWTIAGLCLIGPWRRFKPPIELALVATAAAVTWLMVVAVNTKPYLSDIFGRALDSFGEAITAPGARRVPFQSLSGVSTPPLDRALAVGAVLIAAAGVAGGLILMRARWRAHPLLVLIVFAAPGYVIFLGLRIVPGAWEIGSRSSEFLFIGVALLLALCATFLVDSAPARPLVSAGVVVASVVLVIGGSVVGWSQASRLPRPFQVAADGGVVEPQGAAVARWATEVLPRSAGIVADDSNGRLLAAAGFYHFLFGREPGAHDLFEQPRLPDWVRELLKRRRIAYVVFDRRISSTDSISGQFYPRPGEKRPQYPRVAVNKLQRLGLPVAFSSGDIRVYDVRSITGAQQGAAR